MKPSKRFSLNFADYKAQAWSAFIFLLPTIVSFLTAMSPLVDMYLKGTPEKVAFAVIFKWGLDQLVGLSRRYVAGK